MEGKKSGTLCVLTITSVIIIKYKMDFIVKERKTKKMLNKTCNERVGYEATPNTG